MEDVASAYSEPMRLQRYLSRAGVASRRNAEREYIAVGRVSVNGRVVADMGYKVDPLSDTVAVDGVPISLVSDSTVLLLNKPQGYLTAMRDDRGRDCVSQLVPTDRFPGLYPIGRLDRDTTGLLLFSTDGQLGHGLLHPAKEVYKCYVAQVTGVVSEERLAALREGVQIDDRVSAPAYAAVHSHLPNGVSERNSCIDTSLPNTTLLEIRIHEGRKHQVKDMCKAVGLTVVRLHRFAFGSIELGDLELGSWRKLDDAEVSMLRDGAHLS